MHIAMATSVYRYPAPIRRVIIATGYPVTSLQNTLYVCSYVATTTLT